MSMIHLSQTEIDFSKLQKRINKIFFLDTLRKEMDENLGDDADSIKSKLTTILDTTSLTDPSPADFAEYMVHGLHDVMFTRFLLGVGRAMIKGNYHWF